ncbi:Spo0A activation inhibitor protein [Halorhabdus tiamatea SARL4B]|uniref:Spo0A activation inhibitor protein n=1 Tax=Halorhabdus tiamatea SARL4B TaxID=1033806 RepID=U2DPE0_9EURY|nr:ParA family protein [Halorhabdus tiamatea]ERJ07472.1 Spo0A activation inhibitor protein [Halorhabdus tiamatea SARL4B]
MHSFTTWTEGGGEGKTWTTIGTARSLVDKGYDVLVVDMDGQKGGFSSWLGLLNDDKTPSGDSIVDFLADNNEDPIQDLIRTREGIDVIPSSRQLRDLNEALYRLGGPRQQEVPDEQLRRVVEENQLYEDYDVMIVDVPKEVEDATKNALFATRNVLVPLNPGPKGEYSVDGIVENLASYEQRKQLDIGTIGVVPNDVDKQLNETTKSLGLLTQRIDVYEEQADRTVPIAPVAFAHRESLIKESWRAEVSPHEYHREHRERQRANEAETLENFDKLAEFLLYQLSGGDLGSLPEREEILQEAASNA